MFLLNTMASIFIIVKKWSSNTWQEDVMDANAH